MCEGGWAMTDFVQSPAAETRIVAERLSSEGMVANACHSFRGEREKRAVEVGGMEG